MRGWKSVQAGETVEVIAGTAEGANHILWILNNNYDLLNQSSEPAVPREERSPVP